MKTKIIYLCICALCGLVLLFLMKEFSVNKKNGYSLEMQKICAEGAKKYFERISTGEEIMVFHYNLKLDKCFLVTDLLYRNYTTNSNEKIKIIYDVFEERKYGYLNKNFGENTTLCSMPNIDGLCSELEFNEEVNKLLRE